MDLLERLLRINIGDELVNDTWKKLEDHFQQKASNLRDYFEMLDSRVAELKQIGGGEEMILMQRQECYILANNFIGKSDLYGDVYLSRMIVPFSQVMVAKVMEDMLNTPKSKLKYLHFNLHDTNISNFLRFLGYWESHGYKKHVKFGSSVRLEILKIKDQSEKTCHNKDYESQDLF